MTGRYEYLYDDSPEEFTGYPFGQPNSFRMLEQSLETLWSDPKYFDILKAPQKKKEKSGTYIDFNGTKRERDDL